MNQRVLIVGYFHPDANMGGVRIRRIARLLPQHGWDPVVLTHPSDASSVTEESRGVRVEAAAAPDLTRIYRKLRNLGRREAMASPASRPEPKALATGLTSQINRWLMIPDKQVTWYSAAVRRGLELLRAEKFSAIFASLEPRTSLLVAARLSKETGVPCVFEYRDLWTGNPYHHITQATAWHRWFHGRLERKALRQARRVSAVCRGIAKHLEHRYADVLQAPVELNYNFFDPDEYPAPVAGAMERRPFTISYTGAMYATRSPHQFFEGMRTFIDRTGLTPGQFRFRWAGGASGIKDLGEILDRTAVRPHLDFLGQIPHREALRLLMESDAALLIQAPDDAIHIPGKLYEALGARVPLLALTHPCETADILHRCRAGILCPHTSESVAEALAELHRFSLKDTRWEFNEAEVRRFSADTAVAGLAALFNQACV